jgi:hypothetical protein
MTTAVCKAADILGVRSELVEEFLASVSLTNRFALAEKQVADPVANFTMLCDTLIEEYDRKI